MRVAVLGAGGAGLAAARVLQKAPVELLVFEAADRTGGKIHSHSEGGFLCEEGPNSIAAVSPTALRLATELGLEMVEARPPRTRYVLRNGKVRTAPSFGLLSPLGWVRALLEPVAGILKKPVGEESLKAFLQRHVGEEAGSLGASLLSAGVYAGDPDRLSAREAYPKIVALEHAGGSLLVGGLRASRGGRQSKRSAAAAVPRSLWSLARGLRALPEGMTKALGDCVRIGTKVERLEAHRGGYRLTLSGRGEGVVQVEGIIGALPVGPAAALLRPLGGFNALSEIRSSPLAVVHLGFRASEVPKPLAGFGLLDADGSSGLLGVLFSSSLFGGRAPEGHVLLTALLGGIQHPAVVGEADETLVATCCAAYRRLFGISALPSFQRIVRWPEAVPQPELGHTSRIAAIREASTQVPPLELAGAALGGVSVDQVLTSGEMAATRLLARLRLAPHAEV